MYYYPDLIVSNLFYCTCTIRADVSACTLCLSVLLTCFSIAVCCLFEQIYDDDDDEERLHLPWTQQ